MSLHYVFIDIMKQNELKCKQNEVDRYTEPKQMETNTMN